MDFEDIKSEYSSSNLFNVMRISDSDFSQDAQHRLRKSPRKKLKTSRMSASLVIDQIKNIFWCPGDFMSHVRMSRNWRPEFLMRYLRNNQCDYNERCNAILRHDKKNFVPEVPKIYSIGLHRGTRDLSDNHDVSSSCGAIRNFRKRFSIVRRPITICKYWVTQSTPTLNLSTSVSLKAHTDLQKTITDCKESMDIIPKCNQAEESNSHHSQHIEEKKNMLDILRNNCAADDHSFIPNNFKNSSSVRKEHKRDSFRMTRDAQIQTSNGKNLRKKTKRRSKPATEKITHCKHCNNESPVVVNFRTSSQSSSRRSHRDEPWLRVRVLENKRAEYINKFTAVNRQIEEITATLRETCCSGESSRNNLDCDEYFSSISDDAKVNTINWSGVKRKSTVAGEKNTSKEKKCLVNIKRVIEELKGDRSKNVPEILHVDNLNNETISAKDNIACSKNPEKIPNDTFRGDSVREMETVCSNRISIKNKTKAKCHFIKQMSFDLDVTKNEGAELQKSSIKNEFFNEIYLKNFILNNDEHARDLIKNPVDLKKSRRYNKIVEEKIGEVAILEDIKRRIDRDFDDLLGERSENDTEDFLSISQKSSNFDHHDIIDVSSAAIVKKFKSSPSISATNLEPTESQIYASMSMSAMSEYSNKNSAPSKYFSCTQIPSLISLTENEDELAAEAADRSTIDSHSNLHSTYHYSRSNFSLNNNCSLSNLESSLDRSRSSLEYITRYDLATQRVSPNECPIGTVNNFDDTFEISEGREDVAENKICEFSPLGKNGGKEWRAGKRYAIDSTFETSKSSKYSSIDSGMFSSSLIDFYPTESSFDVDKSFKKKRRARKLDGPSVAANSGSDNSCTDDTLDRKVNDVVKDLTKNLILCERRARMKLRARDTRYPQDVLSRACKFSRNLYDTCCEFFNSPQWSSEDERIVSISTPSLLSLSDSEIEDYESRCQRVCHSNSIQM